MRRLGITTHPQAGNRRRNAPYRIVDGSSIQRVNIWDGNIGGNVGAAVDAFGVNITLDIPNQVFFGWDGTPAPGRIHELRLQTNNVIGDFRIRGRQNDVTIHERKPVGPSIVVIIGIPTAGGETGWSFESIELGVGRFEAQLYDITP